MNDMKKLVVLSVILFAGILFFQCSQNEPIEESSNNLVLSYEEVLTPELVGQLHNECVEYVLQHLSQKAPLTRSTAVADSWNNISYLTKQFLESKGYEVNYVVLSTRSATSFVDYRDLQFNFSTVQNKYFNSIKTIAENSLSITDFIEGINEIKEQMLSDSEISDSERAPLLYGISVLHSSAEYWFENYDRWKYELFGVESFVYTKTTQEATVSSSWWEKNKDVVYADGWWLWQGMVQGAPSGIPAFMIIMGLAEGAGASVIAALSH